MLRHPSSFRDSAGYVFSWESKIYRFISPEFNKAFHAFSSTSLYSELTERGWLIAHQKLSDAVPSLPLPRGALIIEPDQLEFVSYPFEWAFSQLQASALLTLDICMEALQRSYILKDASAYNVQLHKGSITFIDSLSFVEYQQGQSWNAYRQFVNHFLNPLLLMAKVDPSLNMLLRVYLDGIPCSTAARMLPWSTLLHPIAFMNVWMHAYLEKRHEKRTTVKPTPLPKAALLNMLKALREYIAGLEVKSRATAWADYYSDNNYESTAFQKKTELVSAFLGTIAPRFSRILDLGANDGTFSRIVAPLADQVISVDVDPLAIEANFKTNAQLGVRNVYPLRLDFLNPSPDIGWNCSERSSFFKRVRPDVTLCLAFLHHMVIGENVPFSMISQALAALSPYLIIEFVAEDDSQVRRMMATRTPNHRYSVESFEAAFQEHFTIEKAVEIPDSKRRLYLLKRRN